MKVSLKFALFFFFTNVFSAEKTDLSFYKKVFPSIDKVEEIKVEDTISDDPVNKILLKAYAGTKHIGFIREINTTTGCNSACLPVSYTSFFNASGGFNKILSRGGLTKINHAPFTPEDYSKLEFILVMAPKEFDVIKHPKELTDAISGATLRPYQEIVVKGAAYSTLRIHLYNLNTQNLIKSHLKKD